VEGWAGTYLSALVQQRLCKGSAYALRGAGHQRHFAVHVHGALLLGARWASPRLCAAAAFMAPALALAARWAGMRLSGP
jgi:hypothetical protein